MKMFAGGTLAALLCEVLPFAWLAVFEGKMLFFNCQEEKGEIKIKKTM